MNIEFEKECIISIKNDDNLRTDNQTSDLADESSSFSNNDNTPVETTDELVQSQPDSVKQIVKNRETSNSPVSSHGQDAVVDPIDLYRKLEIIKEIKTKTVYLQRIKSRISQEIDCIESETKSIIEFKNELDLLVQEERAHLEELRQIQNDISVMENTIKQTNEEKIRALESAKRLHHEYKPLKDQVNHLRDSIGLPKTDDNEDEELIDSFIKKLSPITTKQSKSSTNTTNYQYQQRAEKQPKLNSENSHRPRKNSLSNKSDLHTVSKKETLSKSEDQFNNSSNSSNSKSFQSSQGVNEIPVQLATAALMAHSLRGLSPNSLSQHQKQFQQHFNPFILNQVNMNNDKFKSLNNSHSKAAIGVDHNQPTQHHQQLQSLPPPFRQQPPPMKTCLSCNQQIHRNAPICPLCKAKSRSTNPKKPKKKQIDTSSNTMKSTSTKNF